MACAHKKHMADSEKEKGNEAFYAKDFEEAEAYYTRSLQYMADDVSTWSNRALVRLKLQKPEAALQDCEHALALNSNYVKALHRKGKALYEMQRYDDAVRTFQQALLLSPGNSQINGDLMVARRKLRDAPQEVQSCRIEELPDDEPVGNAKNAASVPLRPGYTRVEIEEDSDSEEEERSQRRRAEAALCKWPLKRSAAVRTKLRWLRIRRLLRRCTSSLLRGHRWALTTWTRALSSRDSPRNCMGVTLANQPSEYECLFFQVCFAKFADISQVSIAKFTDGTAEEREQQVQKLRNAFETQGMVVLMDTGFPEDVVEKTIQRSRDFFALPRAAKEHFFEPPGYPPRSYGAVTTPRGKHYMLQQSDDSGNILNEWLLVRNTTVQSDMKDPYYSSDEGREFFSSESKHPEQQEWPDQVPGLQEATAAYYVQVQKLANTMYRLFALAMGEQEDFFISRAKRAPIWPVTIAHYPPQLKDPGERKARIQPHWDRTLFALITTSDRGDEESNGGLQILVDKETGEGVDGRAEVEGRATEWQSVVRPAGGFVVNCGEMMSRWSNGRLKHVVHRVQNPVPGHADADRISLMAYVLPDYDAVVECEHCKRDGSKPLYDKTWVGEMMNWASKLPIYNKTKQDLMRMAQGLYTRSGSQTKLGEPTDVKSLEQALQAPISILDIGPLHNGTWEEKQSLAQQPPGGSAVRRGEAG
ncbi:unnamed protein product [Effrenium voratum]|uniref:Fe2OG dioxygenase domain-containing protein n=1 Tax=Effrenium voratum TaxID=2562239 RepID=A0AA36N5U5_9DINO|nr:unnamed protein product [Effrenium voratum]